MNREEKEEKLEEARQNYIKFLAQTRSQFSNLPEEEIKRIARNLTEALYRNQDLFKKMPKRQDKIFCVEITDKDGKRRRLYFKHNGDPDQASKIAKNDYTDNDISWELCVPDQLEIQLVDYIDCAGCVSNKYNINSRYQCYCSYWEKDIGVMEQCTVKEINTLHRRLKLLWYCLTISNYHAINWSRSRLLRTHATKMKEWIV